MSRILAPIYNTITKEIEMVSPGVVEARLLYNNASVVKFNQTNRGTKGIYLPAEQAPQAPTPPEATEETTDEAPVKKTRQRRTTTKK